MSVPLVIQETKRICHVILSVTCPVLPYFPTISLKRHDFWANVIEHEMFVLIFSTPFFLKKILYCNKNALRYCNKCTQVLRRVSVIVSILQLSMNSLERFSKNTQISNFITTPNCGRRNIPFGWVEEQTDREIHGEANSLFSQFHKRA